MRVGILGPLLLVDDAGAPVPVPETKVRFLLAVLAAHEGHPVSADTLIDALWDDNVPAHPERVLRTKLSQLRRALDAAEPGGRERLTHEPGGYRLHLHGAELDVLEFADLLQRAEREDETQERVALRAAALRLWRGTALNGFDDALFAPGRVAQWETERLTATEAWAQDRLDLGQSAEIASDLAPVVAANPLRESLVAVHMQGLYRSGRQAEALEAFEALRRRLSEELGTDPGPGVRAVHQAILRREDQPAPSRSVAAPAASLPIPLGDLVGRDAETSAVDSSLRGARLVTLTGAGGVGKTRLALAVAHSFNTGDGVCWVELDTLTPGASAGMVAATVARALGLTDHDDDGAGRLVTALRRSTALIVLDNAEHVVDAAAQLVAKVVAVTPGVRVLTTSRRPLLVPGEQVYEVPPLGLPVDGAERCGSAAVELFTRRAREADLGFTFDDDTAPVVAAICRRLDGLPLAVELAARQVRALGVDQIAARLDNRFGILAAGQRGAPQRHRTLRAMLDWSWNLLTDAEQMVLAHLTVFVGGFDMEAAEAVVPPPPEETAAVLSGLVDQSLVVPVSGTSGRRFRLLESVSSYAREHLAGADAEAALGRHTAHFAALALRADRHLRGADQAGWLPRLDADLANLRIAAAHAVRTGAATDALGLALGLFWYRWIRGQIHDSSTDLSQALDVDGGPGRDRALAVALLDALTTRHHNYGSAPERDQAVPRAWQAVADLERYHDSRATALAEWMLAVSLLDVEAPGECARLLGRAAAKYESLGDDWGRANVAVDRVWLAQRTQFDPGAITAQDALQVFRCMGNQWGQINAMSVLMTAAIQQRRLADAVSIGQEALVLAQEESFHALAGDLRGNLGQLALDGGDLETAAEHFQHVRRLGIDLGMGYLENAGAEGLAQVNQHRGADSASSSSHPAAMATGSSEN